MYSVLFLFLYSIVSLNSWSDGGDLMQSIGLGSEKVKKDDDYYYDGIFEFSTRSYQDALDEFKNLKINYPFSRYTEMALLMEVFLLYVMSDFDKMEVAVNDFLLKYPMNENKPYMIYMKTLAISNLALKHKNDKSLSTDSIRFCKYNIENYGGSFYGAKSFDLLTKVEETLYEQEIKIADYYYDNGDFLSASSRYIIILEELDFLDKKRIEFMNF